MYGLFGTIARGSYKYFGLSYDSFNLTVMLSVSVEVIMRVFVYQR